jgi:hypothetical protein
MQIASLVKPALYVFGSVPALAGMITLVRTPWVMYQRSAHRKARERALNIIVGLNIVSAAIIIGTTALLP